MDQVNRRAEVRFQRRRLHRPARLSVRLQPPYVGRFLRGGQILAEGPRARRQVGYRPKRMAPVQPVRLNLPQRRLRWPVRWEVIPHGLMLLLGCGLSIGLVWNLQGAGRGLAVLGMVQAKVQVAYEKLGQAQAALAETDFAQSESNFAASQNELQQAWQQLETALASSRRALVALDVSGTVRSGETALVAGAALSEAGVHVSRGLKLMTDRVGGTDLVGAVMAARPELAAAADSLQQAEDEMAKVTISRLPEAVQAEWEQMQAAVPRLRLGLGRWLAGTDSLLSVLGAEHDRQYLLLFENNHELRPTGGFVGSLGLVNVRRGAVENVAVSSVYDPDGQLLLSYAPPEPLRRIVDRWFLRDANWFVDYRVSARTIADFLEKEKGPTVDGVIALTPEVIKSFLKITGPIEVPAYAVTVDADNFVPLTQDEVTYNYDREQNKPKQFLQDMAPVLMNRLMQVARERPGEVLAAVSQTLAEKQLLLYFRDEAIQQRVEAMGWAGVPVARAPGFLSVNNANIGGHKSDQFIEQELDYRVEVRADRSVEAVLTIRRTHHGPTEALARQYPPEENPAWRDNVIWQRVLVPVGAELLEATGFSAEPKADPAVPIRPADQLSPHPLLAEWQRRQHVHASGTVLGEEAGHQYFANWLVTKPGQTTIALYRYRLPAVTALPGRLNLFENYAVQIVKQPGEARTAVRAELVLPDSMRLVAVQPEAGITREAENRLVYRGSLSRDTVIGATYERK